METPEIKVPDGISGDWRVETFEVSQAESDFTRMRAMMGGRRRLEYVAPGKYKRLMRGGTVVMSNTKMEIDTHWSIIHAAKGDVLLNGLGLGVILTIILGKPDVKSVTVVEKSEDVIELVAPTYIDSRVSIIQADAFSFNPSKRLNAVWHDIWDDICEDNISEMKTLHRRYGRRAEWQGSWSREVLR